ncbi:hypothetical protein [Mycobacterium sp. 1081908.1]|uniref:hypothetical protein n=1 Tax=Mycobacterium sp. 1081908.1 TaxID=1834066 RepID=UPI00080088F0|nr:hypothetical protein [Mycobacterium sp. 1081908.1]OBK43263.1 hypothetical protein A5655_17020 [Mycobacterium sp. 1081908.1]
MPKQRVPNTDLNLAVLGDESVTRTSADRSAEKSKKPAGLRAHAKGHSATEDTVDVERKK